MFSLDYRTISQTLQTMRYTGSVKAIVPSGTFAGGTLILKVQGGAILTCVVITSGGKQIQDPEYIAEQLARSGPLEWHVNSLEAFSTVEKSTPPRASMKSTPTVRLSGPIGESDKRRPLQSSELMSLSPTSYPRRFPVDPIQMNTWPIIYRQVYNLSTGQYSEQDIARLLRYSLTDLLKVFDDLQRMGILVRGI